MHPLSFENGHALGPSDLLKFDGKAQKLLLALIGELDRTATEKDRSLHFGSLLEEFLGMLEFELEVMLICVGAESYLLYDYLGSILLHLFGALTLLIEIFLIVKYFTNRRISLRTYLNKIQFLLLRHCEGFG